MYLCFSPCDVQTKSRNVKKKLLYLHISGSKPWFCYEQNGFIYSGFCLDTTLKVTESTEMTELSLDHSHFKVPLASIVCFSHTFENNLGFMDPCGTPI